MDLELELFLLDQKSHDPQREPAEPRSRTAAEPRRDRLGPVLELFQVNHPWWVLLTGTRNRTLSRSGPTANRSSSRTAPEPLQNRSATQTPLNSPHSPPAARHSGSEPDPNSELPGSALQDMCGFFPTAKPRSQSRAEPNRAELSGLQREAARRARAPPRERAVNKPERSTKLNSVLN